MNSRELGQYAYEFFHQSQPKKLHDPIFVNIGEDKVFKAHNLEILSSPEGLTNLAKRWIFDFARKRWIYSEADGEFKDKRLAALAEQDALQSNYRKFVVIIACDWSHTFHGMEQYFEFFIEDNDKFEECYQACIEVNPNLVKFLEDEEAKEKEDGSKS